jgi:hypothetical protein
VFIAHAWVVFYKGAVSTFSLLAALCAGRVVFSWEYLPNYANHNSVATPWDQMGKDGIKEIMHEFEMVKC